MAGLDKDITATAKVAAIFLQCQLLISKVCVVNGCGQWVESGVGALDRGSKTVQGWGLSLEFDRGRACIR